MRLALPRTITLTAPSTPARHHAKGPHLSTTAQEALQAARRLDGVDGREQLAGLRDVQEPAQLGRHGARQDQTAGRSPW